MLVNIHIGILDQRIGVLDQRDASTRMGWRSGGIEALG